MDFLWHKVSEKEKEEIKNQAKKIVEDFSKKLSKVSKMPEPFIEREENDRDERLEPLDLDRKIMFENALSKKGDFIVAEKGGW